MLLALALALVFEFFGWWHVCRFRHRAIRIWGVTYFATCIHNLIDNIAIISDHIKAQCSRR